LNKHLIEVRYIPATASKPTRISLTSHWNGERVIFQPRCTMHFQEALEKVNGLGFKYESYGIMKRGHFIIVNEFKSLKG
jgi:hypothetical protein